MPNENQTETDPDGCPFNDEELAEARLGCAIDDLETAGRNIARDRNCGTMRKLKLAALEYVRALADVKLEDENQLPDNLISELVELVNSGDDE